MIILDENILDGQRLLLDAWGLAARQIGVNLGRKGLKDEEIVVLLRQHRDPTFFTRDAGFYNKNAGPLRLNHTCGLRVRGPSAVTQYRRSSCFQSVVRSIQK